MTGNSLALRPLLFRPPNSDPTVIIDQRYNAETQSVTPPDPTWSTLVLPVEGQYCIFDGALGHGVLDSPITTQRVTLLINWWKAQPRALTPLADVNVQSMPWSRWGVEEKGLRLEGDAAGSETDVDAATVLPKSSPVPVIDVVVAADESEGCVLVRG